MKLLNKRIKVPIVILPKPDSLDPFIVTPDMKTIKNRLTYHIEYAPSWSNRNVEQPWE